MLARTHRLTRGTDYQSVVRRGRRCVGVHTVTYVGAQAPDAPTIFGFIVSKKVGGAVQRNRVRRRLKAICAESLDGVRPGASVVIRALPSAVSASYAELRDDVAGCLRRRAA